MSFRSFSRFFTGKNNRTIRKARPRKPGSTVNLLIDKLEDRFAPATLPAPTVSFPTTGQGTPGELDLYANPHSVFGPQVAMNPVNPNMIVEIHSAYFDSTNDNLDQGEMWGTVSLDKGQTWSSFRLLDVAINDPTRGPTPALGNNHPYVHITNVSVTFDRTDTNTIHVVSRQTNAAGTSGAIVYQKYTVNGTFFQQDNTVGNRPEGSDDYVLYQWVNNIDAAFNPIVAIDNNEPSYTDPITGLVQTDSMATLLNDVDTDGPGPDQAYGLVPKGIYVAWNTNHVRPFPFAGSSNASNIIIAASADGGHNFSTHQFVTKNLTTFSGSTTPIANAPRIVFSQGTPYDASDPFSFPTLSGGTMSIVFSDSLDPVFNGSLAEIYVDSTQPDGGDPTAYAVSAMNFVDDTPNNSTTGTRSVFDAVVINNVHVAGVTDFIVPVTFGADGFISLDDLDVEIHLQTPHAAHLRIDLIAPNNLGTFRLLNNRLNPADGNVINPNNPPGLPDVQDIGIVTGPGPINGKNLAGTFFDLDAIRSIDDNNSENFVPWIGHYRPESGDWSSLYNLPIAQLEGDWTLRFTDVRNDGGNPPPQVLHRWGLHFTSTIDTDGFSQAEDFVALAGVRTDFDNTYPTTNPAVPQGVSPGVVAAYDNTLGSFSPYQGRLYVAFVTGTNGLDIGVRYSDDGGASWSQTFRVNDDSATDGFSEGNRLQFMPSIAVDPVSGAVVVSYYDGRFDASRLRVATALAVSIDGGRSYGESVYLNDIKGANDFLTGERVDIEPIPGHIALNGLYGFGERQGLVVHDGQAIPVFGTNYDANTSRIRTANVFFASGPRIVQGDMGPITADFINPDNDNVVRYNDTYAQDGTRRLDGIVVTFDRPVDPATFTIGDVTVIYRNPITGQVTDISNQVTSIEPLDARFVGPAQSFLNNPAFLSANQFLIHINPQSAVGTYSYSIDPDITSRIHWIDYPSGTPVLVNFMDQNNNHVDNESSTTNAFENDSFSVPHALLQVPFEGPYDTDSMPLIIPGPHLAATGFQQGTFSTAPNANIPASGLQGITRSTINVFGVAGQLADLNVRVNINYADSSHLILRLIAPNGDVVVLANNQGNGNFYGNTLFDDQAAFSIVGATGPFGHVRPQNPLGALNFLANDIINGEWTLEIEDTGATLTGKLVEWSLNLTTTNTTQQPRNQFSKQANEVVGFGTLISTIPISGLSGWVTDINVRVHLDAPRNVSLVLRAPNGVSVTLASANGDDNFFLNTLFDDEAAIDIDTQDPHGPFYHVRPIGLLSRLDGVEGAALSGNWELRVTAPFGSVLEGWSLDIGTSHFTDNLTLNDSVSHLDVVFDRDITAGTFTAADILRMVGPAGVINGPFTVTANPAGTPVDFANRTFRIGFPTQSLSGTYQITFSPDIAAVGGAQLKVDNNFNPGLGFLLGGEKSTGVLKVNSYSPTNVAPNPVPGPNTTTMPQVIPASGSVTVNLQVTEGFRIVQDLIQHIQVKLDIAPGLNDPELDAVLIAPDGTEIRLFSRIGGFTQITLDDFATTPVQPGQTFGLGTFNPQIPLSRLKGKFTSGTWQLQITNTGSTPGLLNDWSLRFPYYESSTGLGEPVADQFTTGFRIFTLDPTNALSTSTWTAVGPAPTNQFGSAGRVTAIALDPSDPTGNTVYIGSASGGVWKTSNFLTTLDTGPTYVALTDLGPSNSLNINSITVIPRNNDPRQSIVLVGTGDTDTLAPGIGLLRSMDGGATWQVIDSTNQNFDASGNPLALNDPLRNHDFVGGRVNKVIYDPTAVNGGVDYYIYVAVAGGPAPGLYRSTDTGNTWFRVRAGNATDVTLAPASIPSPGTLMQRLYAGFQGDGVYTTTSAPTTSSLSLMAGGVGKPNHTVNGTFFAMGVNDPASTPTGSTGRILLATPALTGDRLIDTFTQNWLYALVVNNAETGVDLYLTKDRGDNWTRVLIPVSGNFNNPPAQTSPPRGFGVPTNDENVTDTSSELYNYVTAPTLRGQFQAALAVDPTNPNIIYVGTDYLIKVDVTKMYDPWSMIIGDHSDNVGGAATGVTAGGVSPGARMLDTGDPATPGVPSPRDDHFNMYRDPYNPFLTPSQFLYSGSTPPNPLSTMQNNGHGVVWYYADVFHDVYDTALDQNLQFSFSNPTNPGSGQPFRPHELLTIVDPLTGKTRLLLGNDQGVYTAVDKGDGTPAVHTGIGTVDSVRGSRNGNLQIAQFVSGASQPSTLAADVAGALFYGMAVNNGTAASSAGVVFTGNLNWQTYDQTRTDPLVAFSVDANGSWIVTDATGGFDRIEPDGTIIFDPNRIGVTYQYQWPLGINQSNLTNLDFFVIDFPNLSPISRTTGLLQSSWFSDTSLFNGAAPQPFGRFAVNPLDPTAIVISASNGRLYRTFGDFTGFGIQWDIIANNGVVGYTNGTPAEALAFGALPLNAPNQNDFIYAGTNGGEIFVTFNGGGAWTEISAGLDGSRVMSISPSPVRGSREAYAITTNGVYYMLDSQAAGATWVKLNDDATHDSLFNFTRPVFNNLADQQAIMLPGQIGSLAVDWRYAIPDDLGNPAGPKHPILYVAGNAGVFISTDKGITWRLFPDVANDGAPQEGGYLPNVRITDLDLMLGNLNPETGSYSRASSANVLMASTYGRGAFAIRLPTGFDDFLIDFTSGPKVIDVDPVLNTTETVLLGFDVLFDSLVYDVTFTPADVTLEGPNGQNIPIVSVLETTNVPPGGLNPHNSYRISFNAQPVEGVYKLSIGPNLTDFGGNRMNQDGDTKNGEPQQDVFKLNFFFDPNTPPVIAPIADQVIPPGTSTQIPFRISDEHTSPDNTSPPMLIVTAFSNNQAIIPDGNIGISQIPNAGAGNNRIITLTPLPGVVGSVIITIQVEDPQGLFTTRSFNVLVDTAPTLIPADIPDDVAPHTAYPKQPYIDLDATDPDPGATLTFFAAAFADAGLTQPLPTFVAINASTGALDLTPTNFVGTYFVRAGVKDEFNQEDFDVFSVTVTNNAPTLVKPGDIDAHHAEFPIDVQLQGNGNDPNETLTYGAKAYEINNYKAYEFDQALGLRRQGRNYDFNKRGRREKYFKDAAGKLYYILPSGKFFKFKGPKNAPQLRGTLLHQFTKPYWKNPALIATAQPPTELLGFVSVNPQSGLVTVDPPDGFVGRFLVEATVNDGVQTAKQTFLVTVRNTAPFWTATIGSVEGVQLDFQPAGITRDLDGGDADPLDAPNLTYSATAYEALTYQAYNLDQQYKLSNPGNNYNFNARRKKEKYLKGAGNKLFYILPDGSFFQFQGSQAPGSPLKGKLLATFDPSYYASPPKLWNAPLPTQLAGFVSVDNNNDTITFTPSPTFTGIYFVDVFVSDGVAFAKQVVKVTVNPNPP